MQLYVASDHRGFTVKQRLLTFLAEYQNQHPEMNIEVKDLGPLTIQPGDDFNDSAIAVSRAVRENPTARGFLICGSAHGIRLIVFEVFVLSVATRNLSLVSAVSITTPTSSAFLQIT